MTVITQPITSEDEGQRPYPWLRLTAGIAGRLWLWLVAICLLIPLLPQLFGWHSYVIAGGSMEPGIRAGDVVLASPDPALDATLGRVISFEDPARAGHVLTHRVVAINEDGTVVTRGDANPTPDAVPVPPEAVTGLGRLLVRFVGLPLVWLGSGRWGLILLNFALLVAAVIATVADHEPKVSSTSTRRPGTGRRPPPRLAGLVLMTGLLAGLGVGLGPMGISGAAFSMTTLNTADSWAIPNWVYTTEVNALGSSLFWKLDETGTATVAADSSGNGRTGTYNPDGGSTNFTRLSDGALVTDTPDRAVQIVGSNACINRTSTTGISGPQVFTIIVWFKAPSTYTNGGKLIGFETPRTGVAAPPTGSYDRHIYMDGNGRIWFGVYNGGNVAISSATGLNNNQWHMAVGTQSGAGMRLYIDGAQVASNGNTTAQSYTGWWRVGCGNLAGWGSQWGGSNNPGTSSSTAANRVFTNSLDEVTLYSGTALTTTQIAWLYWVR